MNGNGERPQDRIHQPKRLVKMKLDLDLVDALEVMAEIHDRTFHNMIDAALRWACCKK